MAMGETSAVKLIPFLARLLLCAALLPMGWRMVFASEEFSLADANRLFAIGVCADGLDWQVVQTTGFGASATNAQPNAAPANPTTPRDPPRSTRNLYRVALAAHDGGVPYPALVAWLVAVTLLGGSILLLAGAFTRVMAFAIACVALGALWTTSIPAIRAAGWWSMVENDQLHTFALVGLFLFALDILLVGPGYLSFDGMMTRAPKKSGGKSATAKPARGETN